MPPRSHEPAWRRAHKRRKHCRAAEAAKAQPVGAGPHEKLKKELVRKEKALAEMGQEWLLIKKLNLV